MGKISILATGALATLFMVWSSCNAAVSDSDSVGLRIVATHTLDSNRGVPVIAIKGTITNETERERAVPRVRIAEQGE